MRAEWWEGEWTVERETDRQQVKVLGLRVGNRKTVGKLNDG